MSIKTTITIRNVESGKVTSEEYDTLDGVIITNEGDLNVIDVKPCDEFNDGLEVFMITKVVMEIKG